MSDVPRSEIPGVGNPGHLRGNKECPDGRPCSPRDAGCARRGGAPESC